MEYQFLKIESTEHRLNITINNPPVNILTGAVMKEMIVALKDAEHQKSLRTVVIYGEGKAWSAGADVGEHMPGKFEEMLDVFGELCELIRTYPVVTVAAVDGLCLGGGCEVAAMCDFVIATERSKFGQPEIQVGVIPPVACAHFPRRFGLSHALEVILSGDVFDAKVAHHLGLASQVVGDDKFEEKVEGFVNRFANNSAEILRIAKKATLSGYLVPPDRAAHGVHAIYHQQVMNTKDAVEGLNTFLEKRKPEWQDE